MGVFCEVKTRKFDALKSKKPLVILMFSKSPIRTLAPKGNPNLASVQEGFGFFYIPAGLEGFLRMSVVIPWATA